MRQIWLTTCLVLLAVNCNAGDKNWPQFRGPSADGQAVDAQLPVTWSEQDHVKWKTPIHDRGWSSPVVWDDQIWLTTATADGKQLFVLCVQADTGEIVLDKKLFDVETPREIHVTNSYASPTPVVDEQRVYVHFGSYGTACLDRKSGEILWSRRDLPCNHWRGPGSSPIVLDHLLIIHYDGFDYQYVVALNRETGETIWKMDRDIDYGTDNGDFMKAFSTPIVITVDGRKQLVSPAAKATLAYDPYTGKELWRIRYTNHSATARPLFGHGLLFINNGFGKAELMAVRPGGSGDVTDTHVEWIEKRGIGSKPSQLLIGDLIFVVHESGTMKCIEAKSGETVWENQRLDGNFSASPVYAGGHMYFCDEEGKTTVIKPARQFESVAVNALDDGCMASPAITGNALIIRTRTHLYRIE